MYILSVLKTLTLENMVFDLGSQFGHNFGKDVPQQQKIQNFRKILPSERPGNPPQNWNFIIF